MEKKCAKCGVIKSLNEFNKLSRAKDGHHYRCKPCCNSYYKSLYPKIKDKKSVYAKKRYLTNRDDLLKKAKQRYDYEKKKEYNKKYNISNRLKLNDKKNQYEKNKVLINPEYRLIKLMRKLVYRTIKNKKVKDRLLARLTDSKRIASKTVKTRYTCMD